LYDRLVDEARRVFRETEADGGRARFAALFWVQGEQDTKTDRRGTGGESLPPPPQPEAALQYETNLRALIAALRRDLAAAAAAAELPVVIAGTPVGRAPDYALERSRHAATPAVVAAQQRVGATTPGAVYVPTEGVPRGDDGLHLTGEGGRLLAKRMVEAYVALCAQQARGGEEAS
jgi:lysophospholipase L1-like esterase